MKNRSYEFFNICYDVSEYARKRKRGHNWFHIFVSQNDKQLLERVDKCIEDDNKNPVAIMANHLLECRRNKRLLIRNVVEALS